MITDAIRQAQIMHRAAIEATYNGSCNIYNTRVSAVLSTEAPLLFILIHNFKKMPKI